MPNPSAVSNDVLNLSGDPLLDDREELEAIFDAAPAEAATILGSPVHVYPESPSPTTELDQLINAILEGVPFRFFPAPRQAEESPELENNNGCQSPSLG